jgi:hypothetical protein
MASDTEGLLGLGATPLPDSEEEAVDGPIGWVREIVLNSPDPQALAAFWARLVGGQPLEWYAGWVTLEPPPHGQRLSFQQSEDAPGEGVHLDVLVEDLEAAHGVVTRAGGTFLEERWSPRPGPEGEAVPWRVYADPHGHRFCLVVR